MFRKSFKIKSNARLKTTEKKKFRNELKKEYPDAESLLSHDALSLKSNISVVDVVTNSGECVKVYTWPEYPLFVLVNGKHLPTIYMLWQVPSLVPYFTIHPCVMEKIRGGADLMLPGVIIQEPFSPNSFGVLKKGDGVAINTLDNGTCVAIGHAAMSSQDMYNCGKRGKCVCIVHFLGDCLSEFASNIDTTEIPIKKVIQLRSEENDTQNSTSISESDLLIPSDDADSVNVASISLVNDDLNFSKSENSDKLQDDSVNGICVQGTEDISMEELLSHCFFKALITSAKKVALPLLTNVFYKVHMMNVYPQGSLIDIKRSQYRKLSVFLDKMCDLKIITIEQSGNGIHKITRIDYGNPLVKEFARINPQECVSSKTKVTPQTPSISEKYTINMSVLPLFSKYSYRKGDLVTQTNIRKVITTYVKDQHLQDDDDKRFVKIDELLKNIMKVDVNSLMWEDIVKSITDNMGQSYQVNLPSNKMLSGKGKMPLIDIQVSSRAGNKKVTLINNLSFYGVKLNDFSKECQHGVAASTTINSLPHLKSDQVQVQGSHVSFIGKLLTDKYHIPKRYIRGLP